MAQAITLARPYARAAFELAHATGAMDAWSMALAFSAAAAGDVAVVALSNDPRMQPRQLVTLHLPVGMAEDAPYARFLGEVAIQHRMLLLPEIAELFDAYKRDSESQLLVKVTSALALDGEQTAQLKASLKRRFKREIELETHVDASLLAGVIVDTGEQVIDGSARGRIAKLADALAS